VNWLVRITIVIKMTTLDNKSSVVIFMLWILEAN